MLRENSHFASIAVLVVEYVSAYNRK
jgi:hypothetical protein